MHFKIGWVGQNTKHNSSELLSIKVHGIMFRRAYYQKCLSGIIVSLYLGFWLSCFDNFLVLVSISNGHLQCRSTGSRVINNQKVNSYLQDKDFTCDVQVVNIKEKFTSGKL